MSTPRERFLTSPHAKPFAAIAASTAFEAACDYALLEMQQHMPPNTGPGLPTDPYVGIDANARLQGAMMVLQILKTIHQPIEEPKTPKRNTLNYAS